MMKNIFKLILICHVLVLISCYRPAKARAGSVNHNSEDALKTGDIFHEVKKISRVVGKLSLETGTLIVKFTDLEVIMNSYQSKYRAANSVAALLAGTGVVLQFTPLAPVGWGMTGLYLIGGGGALSLVTELVDTSEYQTFEKTLEDDLGIYNSMVSHLMRISQENLPAEIEKAFREHGITAESLKISSKIRSRNSIFENFFKAWKENIVAGTTSTAKLLEYLKVAPELEKTLTPEVHVLLRGFFKLVVALATVTQAYTSFSETHPTVEKCRNVLRVLRDAQYKFDEFNRSLNDILNGHY